MNCSLFPLRQLRVRLLSARHELFYELSVSAILVGCILGSLGYPRRWKKIMNVRTINFFSVSSSSGQLRCSADLDHTADVQIHSCSLRRCCAAFFSHGRISKRILGGKTLSEAFEGAAVALFDYMTELDKVDIDPAEERELEVSGTSIASVKCVIVSFCT